MSVHVCLCVNNNYKSVFEEWKTTVTVVRVRLSQVFKYVVK